MNNDTQGSKRVLRSTFKDAAGTSGSKVKRLKTTGRGTKAHKDDIKTDEANQTEIGSTQRVTAASKGKRNKKKHNGMKIQTVWSIKTKHKYVIAIPEDTSIGWITGCCLLESGEIIMADFYNKRLKKLDKTKQIVSFCDLCSLPRGMCYIGNNTVAISVGEKLQFVDVTGDMRVIKSVDIEHFCKGITCRDQNLYIVTNKSIFIYNTDGQFKRELYTDGSREAYFQDIFVSDDGNWIYISSWTLGLITIDSTGNHLYTLSDEDLKAPFSLCIDSYGNVFICSTSSGIVMQVSSDGRQKLGQIIKKEDSIPEPRSLCFDEKTNSLTVGCGSSSNVYIFELDKNCLRS